MSRDDDDLTCLKLFSDAFSYEKIFEGHDEGVSGEDPKAQLRNGVGQRLQRQGNAWKGELRDWIKHRKPQQVEEGRVTLGCDLLIEFCDLLHTQMFQSNSETVDRCQIVPARSGADCSLLISVTDPTLPKQPGSVVRYWFPPERQLKQPQTEEAVRGVQQSASSLSLPRSDALEALLKTSSFNDLKQQCERLEITHFGKLNRLQMAESILFQTSCESGTPNIRHQREVKGKVSSFMACRVGTVLTSVIPHR